MFHNIPKFGLRVLHFFDQLKLAVIGHKMAQDDQTLQNEAQPLIFLRYDVARQASNLASIGTGKGWVRVA